MDSPGSRVEYGAVSVGATALLVADGHSTRRSITVQNVHATQILYVGNDVNVTTSNGLKVAAGESVRFDDYNGPVYGIASGATTDTRYWETY